jgi:hypothetical protein
MNWKLLFKITTLMIALSATVVSMYLLNTGHTKDFLSSLGLASSGKTLHWCSDRLLKADGLNKNWSLQEIDRQWILRNDRGQELIVDYLEVEKWLAKYCMLEIQPYPREKILSTPMSPFLKLFFKDNKQVLIYQKDMQVFQMNELTFESADLKEGLLALQRLLAEY